MNRDIVIAQATINELDEAAELFNQYRIFYGQASDLEGSRQFLFDRFEHLESVVFLARDAQTGAAVGFMQLYPTFSSVTIQRLWNLNDLYVVADYRKKQVGKDLLEAAKQFAKQTKSKGLEIATQTTNLRAQGVYERHGYVKDTEFFHYYMHF